MEISSKIISKSLESIGMVQNKSLVLEFPKIPESMYRHFIRGYFDGDGSLYKFKDNHNNTERYGFKITSTNAFCNSVKNIFETCLSVKSHVSLSHPDLNEVTSDLKIYRKADIKKILDWLYADANRYLTRKHDKYIEFLEYINNS